MIRYRRGVRRGQGQGEGRPYPPPPSAGGGAGGGSRLGAARVSSIHPQSEHPSTLHTSTDSAKGTSPPPHTHTCICTLTLPIISNLNVHQSLRIREYGDRRRSPWNGLFFIVRVLYMILIR